MCYQKPSRRISWSSMALAWTTRASARATVSADDIRFAGTDTKIIMPRRPTFTAMVSESTAVTATTGRRQPASDILADARSKAGGRTSITGGGMCRERSGLRTRSSPSVSSVVSPTTMMAAIVSIKKAARLMIASANVPARSSIRSRAWTITDNGASGADDVPANRAQRAFASSAPSRYSSSIALSITLLRLICMLFQQNAEVRPRGVHPRLHRPDLYAQRARHLRVGQARTPEAHHSTLRLRQKIDGRAHRIAQLPGHCLFRRRGSGIGQIILPRAVRHKWTLLGSP